MHPAGVERRHIARRQFLTGARISHLQKTVSEESLYEHAA